MLINTGQGLSTRHFELSRNYSSDHGNPERNDAQEKVIRACHQEPNNRKDLIIISICIAFFSTSVCSKALYV